MRSRYLFCAALAAILFTGTTRAQNKELVQQIQDLRLELQALKKNFGSRATRPSERGFLSELGEHINFRGCLEFEFYGTQSENVGGYTGGPGHVSGTDMRMDSLVLGTDVDFTDDVYLRAELELRGGNEDKGQAGDQFELFMKEAFFGFEDILVNLAGLDDPFHTYFYFGAMKPWQEKFFPRFTESYSLSQTAFYRGSTMGFRLGARHDLGFFGHLGLDDGHDLTIMHAGDRNMGYAQMLSDMESNERLSHHKDLELVLGWDKQWTNNFHLTAAAWYRWGKLSAADLARLGDARLGIATGSGGALDNTHAKRRMGMVVAGNYIADWGDLGVQMEFHDSRDANLRRQTFTFQPSVKFNFDGVLYGERKFFTGMRALYRFSNLDFFGRATTLYSVPDAQLAGADMKMHTFAAIFDITNNVVFKMEYNIFSQDTDNDVDCNEFLIHLGVRF